MVTARTLILVGIVALWSLAIALWRVTLRRLRLSNDNKTRQEERNQRELAVRRSLRGLLAFNFLIVYPVAFPGLVALAFSGDREVLVPGAVLLFGVILLSVALASLIRTARRLEQQRLAGSAARVDELSFWVDGGRAVVEAARQGQNPHARHAAGIIMAAGIGWVASFASGNEKICWLSLGIGALGLLLFEYGQFKRKSS